MNPDRDLDELLDIWLADGPAVVADRVIDDVAVRIVRQRQRPAWRLQSWRLRTMSTQVRIAVLVGALLVMALAGTVLLSAGGRPTLPAPSAAPTATPEPSATTLTNASGLSAGRYVAQLAAGSLALTLPAGWSSADLSSFDFSLHLDAGPADDTVKVFTDMRRAAKNAICTEAPEPKIGGSAKAIADDIAADPNLQVRRQRGVQIDGAQAEILDITLAAGTTRTCPFSSGKPTIPLIVDMIPGPGAFWGIGPEEQIRLVLIDGSNGHNIVVSIDSAAATSFDRLTNAAMPVVESFTFDTTTPGPVDIGCEDDLPGCGGPLAAGQHQSSAFQPGLSFTTPSGWKNVVDTPTIFKLDPASSADPYLIVWSNVAIPSGCGPAILKGSGAKVADFVNFVTHHAGLQVLSNQQTSVGGWPAQVLDLRVKDTYTGTCGGTPGNVIQFIVDTDPLAGAPVYGVGAGGRMHVAFLTVNGKTIIVQAYGPDSNDGFAAAIATVQPLIDSFQFGASS